MKNIIKMLSIILIAMIISGCSHKITISPDNEKIREVGTKTKIDKNVAYFISQQKRNQKFESSGGGGDKINYMAYPDIEAALNIALSKVFNKVYSLNNKNDMKFIKGKKIKYIFEPTIFTTSSSNNIIFWPPEKFKFMLNIKAIDDNQNFIWEKDITSIGYATQSEFTSNFGIAAQKSTEQGFVELINSLNELEK